VRNFSPAKVREYLLEGGVRFELAADFNEISLRESLTGYAMGFVETAIQCVLVGLAEPAIWILEKAAKWLPEAIAKEEDPYSAIHDDPQRSLDGTRSLQYDSLAMSNFLLTGQHDIENLRHAVHFKNRYIAVGEWERDDPELILPLYCDAGEFASAIAIFEQVCSGLEIGDLTVIDDSGSMSYLYSCHRLGKRFSESDLNMARDGFLKRTVPELLGHGNYSGAARWMKLFFWNGEESRDAAWKSVLRCYDYLPGVKQP
jgi:hypothetical protein